MSRFSIAAVALIVAASYCIVLLPQPAALELLREDGPIEQATAVFFLLSCVTLVQAWRLRGARPEQRDSAQGRRSAYLILAALMFVCAGEEMSWGQRIFGWETPAGWSELNAQSETNLHNLVAVEGGVRDPEHQTLLRSLSNPNRLFSLFWLTFFVILPVVDRTSDRARGWFRAVGLPSAPLWIGGLFLLNQAAFTLACRKLNAIGPFSSETFPLDELKEQNFALVYAVVGVAAWFRARCEPSGAASWNRE